MTRIAVGCCPSCLCKCKQNWALATKLSRKQSPCWIWGSDDITHRYVILGPSRSLEQRVVVGQQLRRRVLVEDSIGAGGAPLVDRVVVLDREDGRLLAVQLVARLVGDQGVIGICTQMMKF